MENIFTPFARYTLGITTVLRLANSLDSSQTPTTKPRELFRSNQLWGPLATHKINYSSFFSFFSLICDSIFSLVLG